MKITLTFDTKDNQNTKLAMYHSMNWKNENMNLYADVSKAKKYLNWKSQTDFDYSLKKTIEHYKSNYKQ